MPSAAIVGDTVIFANGDLHARAVDLKTGKQLWSVPLPGVATMASANVHDGVLFLASATMRRTCANARAARTRRANRVDQPDRRQRLFAHGRRGPRVYQCEPERRRALSHRCVTIVAALDERTGRTVWKHESEPGPYTFVASAERQIAGTALSRRALSADWKRPPRRCIRGAHRQNTLDVPHVGKREDEPGNQRRYSCISAIPAASSIASIAATENCSTRPRIYSLFRRHRRSLWATQSS